jgi:PST family polysaccharide transporter
VSELGNDAAVDAVPSADLGRRAVRGAAVILAGQGLKILIQVLSVVVLSRLLSPRDYGLIAMVTAVIGIADIFRDLGLSTAAIQARTLSARQRANLFWINTAVGAFLALAAFCLAPVLAAVYDEPDLVPIGRVLAVTFLLNGLATQYRADLNRRLRFTRLAVADVAAAASGLVAAVAMALAGAGFWSLVGQQVAQYAVMLLLVALGGRWRPGRPSRQVPMGGLLRFGWHMVGTQLVGYVANNADSIVIGTRFGAAPLGLYNRAFQLLMTPLTQVRGPSTQVALPLLSAVQDDDVRFAHYVRQGQLALGYTLIAGLGVMIGAAGPLVSVLLGAEWSDVAPLLSLLALAGALQTLGFVNYWVYLARGLTRPLLQYSLIQAAVKISCIVIGSQWGIVGVAAGYALAPALSWPLSFWWLSRVTSLPVRSLVASAARIIAVLAVVVGGSWSAGEVAGGTGWWAVAAAVAGGAAAYVAVCAVLPAMRSDVLTVARVVPQALRRRKSLS